jgi:hypothetical protein
MINEDDRDVGVLDWAVVLTAGAGASYALLNDVYNHFYSGFGLSPSDVGIDQRHCCVMRSTDALNPRQVRGSDRWSEFGERYGDPRCRRSVESEFVMAASKVLYEGMPGDDDLCGSVFRNPRIDLSRCLSRP